MEDAGQTSVVPVSPDANSSAHRESTQKTGFTLNDPDLSVGGIRKKKAFASLDGLYHNTDTMDQERVTIDITRLPAILGRSNEGDTGNPNFFGLGKKKALSRKHCMIYYRDREGGRVEWDEMTDKLVYKDAIKVAKENDSTINSNPPLPNPREDGLPDSGFFVIECLGKNRITVDKTKLDQGESLVLRQGSSVRISSYLLYFMLPQDAKPKEKSIEIPLTETEKTKIASREKKKKTSKSLSMDNNKSKDEMKMSPGTKKRPGIPTMAAASLKKPKSSTSNSFTATLAELEVLPVEDLIERMNEAVTKGIWDRKNQFIGTTICFHAVRSAASATEIQEKVAEEGGVSRSAIMEWIEKSEQYGDWVQQMLTNMEPRSYQAAITKSLLKSGFLRNSGAGRYIKWKIPDDIPLRTKKKSSTTTNLAEKIPINEENPSEGVESDEGDSEDSNEEEDVGNDNDEDSRNDRNDEENIGDDENDLDGHEQNENVNESKRDEPSDENIMDPFGNEDITF